LASSCNSGGAPTSQVNTLVTPCDHYIACVRQVAPEQAVMASALYALGGQCFNTQPQDVCERACTASMKPLHAANPTAAACALCAADADCSGTTPACDTTKGECVACVHDAQCSGATPACDTTRGVCVACNTSAQCAATETCDSASHTCMACSAPNSCGTCGRTCDDWWHATYPSSDAVDNLMCQDNKCSGSFHFASGDRRACSVLCQPDSCTDEVVWFGASLSDPNAHTVSGVGCDSVPPPNDRNAPFSFMQCTCYE
jgi:hypothetical protein